jgi:hypothetical protein
LLFWWKRIGLEFNCFVLEQQRIEMIQAAPPRRPFVRRVERFVENDFDVVPFQRVAFPDDFKRSKRP